MTEDPFVIEVGRLADDVGRVLIIGADHGALVLEMPRTGPGRMVALGREQQEELGQLLIAAVWQAAWQQQKIDADTAGALAGAP